MRRVDVVTTADLPRISAAAGAAFSPHPALRFGSDALAWMRVEAGARPGQHLRFEYAGDRGALRCTVLEGGALPERLRRCLQDFGLSPGPSSPDGGAHD